MSTKATPQLIKELRLRTGIGMSKCKEALNEAGGDMEKAIENLRKAGMASAGKKEGRETNEGMIAYAENDSAVAIIEVNSETDFVSNNEKFREFVHNLCKDALANNPSSVDEFLTQNSLTDPSLTIDQYRSLNIQSLGENIQIKRLQIIPKHANSSVGIYSHMGGKILTAVVIDGATDQQNLAREIGMHIAAEHPDYLSPDQIPQDLKAKEEEIARSQVQNKPAHIIDKIIEGKLKSFYDQVCLLNQKYIKDTSITITKLLEQESKKSGKTLSIAQFLRWQMGEA